MGTLSPTLASGAQVYNLQTASLNISYVPDLFGLNRRQVEGLQAQEQAQGFELQATYESLAANVVAAAIQVAALQQQLVLADRNVALNAASLAMSEELQRQGAASRLDVLGPAQAVEQARQAQEAVRKQLELSKDLLAVLCGLEPARLQAALPQWRDLHSDRPIPLVLPSALVQRRPDIQAAQAQLHAAVAQLGVAMANRLPQIGLSAAYGGASTGLKDLFANANTFWSLAAGASQTVLDFGTLAHRQQAAQAAIEQAKAIYQSTVLTAFQNVADSLYAIAQDQATDESAQHALLMADQTQALTQVQLDSGAIGKLPLMAAQAAQTQAEIGAIGAHSAWLTDRVALYQALGGSDW